MPGTRPTGAATAASGDAARRNVVPGSLRGSGRSLWLPAIWTGIGAAVVCATAAIVAVAICWLPVAGPTGHTRSAISAGLLTFLASLHGGITVDGTDAAFLPLGMLALVLLVAARAGAGLADVATETGEHDPLRLALALGAQAASFTTACLVAVPLATLGSSSAPFLGVGLAALVVFTAAAGTAFVRLTPLGAAAAARLPERTGAALRGGGAVLLSYLAGGALLAAGAVVAHRTTVETISAHVGGGWGGVPVLLLGVLAAPNAAVAGSAYLAGPGFAVGSATTVSAFGVTHGAVPAFPVLGALPTTPAINPAVYALLAATPVLAGTALARVAWGQGSWLPRLGVLGAGAAVAAAGTAVLAWQAGGSIGDGGLAALGASPWRAGVAVGAASLLAGALVLGVAAVWRAATPRLERLAELATGDALPPLTAVADPDDRPVDDAPGDGQEASELAG